MDDNLAKIEEKKGELDSLEKAVKEELKIHLLKVSVTEALESEIQKRKMRLNKAYRVLQEGDYETAYNLLKCVETEKTVEALASQPLEIKEDRERMVIYAVDPQTKEKRWEWELKKDNYFFPDFAKDDEKVYFNKRWRDRWTNEVVALDRNSGKIEWISKEFKDISFIFPTKENLLVCYREGIAALDYDCGGKILWENLDANTGWDTIRQRVESNGKFYAALHGMIMALDIHTGRVAGKYENGLENCAIAADDLRVYATVDRDTILALDRKLERKLWITNFDHQSPLKLNEGNLYAFSLTNGKICCINPETGDTKWIQKIDYLPDDIEIDNSTIIIKSYRRADYYTHDRKKLREPVTIKLNSKTGEIL